MGAHRTGVFMFIVSMIQNLPENCMYEDIQYHLYVVEKIKNGIDRVQKGETLSHEEAKARMDKWLFN